jgi:hypothetical protein
MLPSFGLLNKVYVCCQLYRKTVLWQELDFHRFIGSRISGSLHAGDIILVPSDGKFYLKLLQYQ